MIIWMFPFLLEKSKKEKGERYQKNSGISGENMRLQVFKNQFGKKDVKYKRTNICVVIILIVVLVLSCVYLKHSVSEKNSKAAASGEEAVVKYSCISKPESKKKIYVILKNYHGDYWKTVIKAIKKATKEIDASVYLGGIDNETDISGQIALMNEAMEQGADGILLAPANSTEMADSCAKARKDNIPVVLIDSAINSIEFDACYMTDNMEAGKMAAKAMLELLKKQRNSVVKPLEVGILLSTDTSQAMVNRISGFLEYWANYAPRRWTVAKDIFFNGGDVEKAQLDASELLQKNKKLKGLFGCNNTSTIGITNTILKKKRTDIVMVGFDLAEETKQFIQNPDYQGVSLMQRQYQMAYEGAKALDLLIKGEKLEKKYFDTGIVLITSEYLTEKGTS